LGFHINPKENSLQKLVQKFERDPMVGSKGYGHFDPLLKSGRQDLHVTDARLADQTSSSMTSDSKATRRKMASGKSCKNLTVI
jgi:hypothetical protein